MIFLACIVCALWTRLLLMLQLTKSLGPTLRIIIAMVIDCMRFLFIWLIVIVCLGSMCSLMFGDREAFRDYTDVIFYMFDTSMGNYDFADFEEATLGVLFGKVFITFCVLINAVIMLNFIIAILAGTYSVLQP